MEDIGPDRAAACRDAPFRGIRDGRAGAVAPLHCLRLRLKADDKIEAFDGTKSCGTARADSNGNWILQISSSAVCNPATGDKITFTLNGAATSASETYKPGGAPKDVARGVTLTGR